MKPVEDEAVDENGSDPAAETATAATAATATSAQKEEDPENINWDELLRTAPKEEGATDGEEVDINC